MLPANASRPCLALGAMTDNPVGGRILVVEDDQEVGAMLLRLLRSDGHAADLAPDGQAGLHLALSRAYDAMIVDRGLPAIDGLELIGRLRHCGVSTPALVLTALGTVADRVAGLDAGAEDYLVKPFEIDELLARIRALLRRRPADTRVLTIGAARFDLVARTVSTGNGSTVILSGRESDLLRLLAEHPSQSFKRHEILTQVFPDAGGDSLVDTYVYYLRRKLGAHVVTTVRGVGYRLGVL
jgi:two-component system response regulator QseB